MIPPVTEAAPRSPHEGKKRLRVLIACDTFPPDINGSATFSAQLAAGLIERGHEVHIAAPAASYTKFGTVTEEHRGASMTVHRIYSWRWYPHPWLRFALPWRIKANSARILDKVKPDVVHFQSHIVIGRGMSIEGRKRGVRVIGTNHFMPENLLDYTAIIPKGLLKKAIRMAWAAADRSFSRAERVTTPTRRAADYLEQNTSVRGVIPISCGLDVHKYTASFEPRRANRIVFLGRIVEEKQIDRLIRAYAMLPADLDAQLEIMGGGDQLHHLQQLAEKLGVRDRIEFSGFVSEEHIRQSLTSATVFAMPSIAELQSISTMEAMASGLPVVAANAMALPHLVHDGENGYLFEAGNAEDLAAKLETVLRLPEEQLQRMKRESLSIVQAHDIQRTLDTFESLYRGEPVEAPIPDAAGSTPAE